MICFKNETFLLHLSRESHVEIVKKDFFFNLKVEPKHPVINITKLVQMIFNPWPGYFGYVASLSHGITTVLNVSIWLLSTSTGLPNCGASCDEKPPARNFASHFWYVQSVTTPSPYITQIFILHFSCIFTFFLKKLINLATLSLDCGMRDPFSHQGSNLAPLHWQCAVLVTGPPGKSRILTFLEIIKHNVQKVLLFSFHLQYKLATQKVTSLISFSFKCTQIWKLPQYNLMKLFQIKLKTTKPYYL